MNKRYRVVLFSLFTALASSVFARENLTLLAPESHPFAYQNGEGGIAIDIIEQLFKRSNIEYELKIVPLKRAIKIVDERPQHCVFPLQRTQERETIYKWVSPLLVTKSTIFSLQSSPIEVTVLEQLASYRIGTLSGSGLENYLNTAKIPLQVDAAGSAKQNIEKLRLGRTELWATDELVAAYHSDVTGIALKPQFWFLTVLRGLACHIETDDQLIDELTMQLKTLYENGTIEEIYQAYSEKFILDIDTSQRF